MPDSENKSVLDVISWCQKLEARLDNINLSTPHVESGSFDHVNNPVLIQKKHTSKVVTSTIVFKNRFNKIPTVMPSITAFNLEQAYDARLQVYVENITLEGADLVVETWRESIAYFVKIDWIAMETDH